MNLLFHICCGPCGTAPARELMREDVKITGLYYNPNVHPSMENLYRRESARVMARSMGFPIAETPDYDFREFFRAVAGREDDRCAVCYRMRLDRTAAAAVAGEFDAFSTSLLVSPYQKHDLLKEIAETAADEHSIQFMYRDFRDIWQDTYELSRDMDLYRQKYCGCIYSEEERFRKKTQRPSCT